MKIMKIILIKVYRFLILVFYNYLSEIILIFLQTLIRLLSCIELISELLILKIILIRCFPNKLILNRIIILTKPFRITHNFPTQRYRFSVNLSIKLNWINQTCFFIFINCQLTFVICYIYAVTQLTLLLLWISCWW